MSGGKDDSEHLHIAHSLTLNPVSLKEEEEEAFENYITEAYIRHLCTSITFESVQMLSHSSLGVCRVNDIQERRYKLCMM